MSAILYIKSVFLVRLLSFIRIIHFIFNFEYYLYWRRIIKQRHLLQSDGTYLSCRESCWMSSLRSIWFCISYIIKLQMALMLILRRSTGESPQHKMFLNSVFPTEQEKRVIPLVWTVCSTEAKTFLRFS